MAALMTEPIPVVSVMLMSADKVFTLRRADSGQWLFPATKVRPDESFEDAAWRCVHDDTGYRLGAFGKRLMRRVKDDGVGPTDCVTFVCLAEQFQPVLDAKHDQFSWFDPKQVIAASKDRADISAGPADDADASFLREPEADWPG
jgi:ADP-ribose pyrophosphatase YjhB (NUDIX family)